MEIITGDALTRLNQLSRNARSIQAAVAYWTLPMDSLDPAFVRAIAHPDGFLCCDIHGPSSIDCLSSLRSALGNVYLHLYQLVGKNDVPDAKGMPDNLMHSKVYVFDDGSNTVQLWVGSHNATSRAMLGINFECAVLTTVDKSSDAYRQVMQHLLTIRNSSTVFDLNHVGRYRTLQGGWGADGFIEAIDNTHTSVPKGTEIGIFGNIPDDHQQLKKVGKRLYLALTHSITGHETFYQAEITQSGKLNGGIRFSDRRFALRFTSKTPTLGSLSQVTTDVLRRATYFVTLKIGDPLPPSTVVVEAPPEEVWSDVPDNEYFQNVRGEKLAPSTKISSSIKRPTYRLQKPMEYVEVLMVTNEQSLRKAKAFQQSSMEERMGLLDHPLIRKRIILKK
jgi:PLD-like domain